MNGKKKKERRPLLLPARLAERFEFLPLMAISVFGAATLAPLWLLSAYRLSRIAWTADAADW